MKRTRWGAVAVAIVALTSTVLAGSSRATVTHCFYDDPNDRVDMQLAFIPDIRMFVTQSGEFKWEDTQANTISDCGAATVNNTNTVDVTDFTNQTDTPEIILDFRRTWGPGVKLEASGIPEIEINVSDNRDHPETLKLLGTIGADHYVAGAAGFNLNGDNDGDDIEITNNPIEELYIKGRGGADTFSVRGGAGTDGQFLTDSVTLQGDSGNDLLKGAPGDENLRGLGGDDDMFGGPGADQISSDDGADLLGGGRGSDELFGMKGPDRLRGRRGLDELNGGSGDDDLDGGMGIDNCDGGPGSDSFHNCET